VANISCVLGWLMVAISGLDARLMMAPMGSKPVAELFYTVVFDCYLFIHSFYTHPVLSFGINIQAYQIITI
jgi:hypothetical protein